MAQRTIASQLRDLSAYVAIGVALLGLIWVLAAHTAKRGQPPSPTLLNWLGLGGMMAIVFISAIHDHRRDWGNVRFWTAWMSALLAEVTVGVLILWNMPKLTVWVWAMLFPVNAGALEMFVVWWLQGHGSIRGERGGPTRG